MYTSHQVPECTNPKPKTPVYVPYALCLISETPIYDVHKILLKKLGSLVSDRITGVCNEKYTVEFYLSVIFHHLFLSLDDSIGVIITSNKTPFISYRNGMNAPMSIHNVCNGLLLQRISISNLFELIKIILLERKLIVVSDNYGDIGHIIECILCLMQPIM